MARWVFQLRDDLDGRKDANNSPGRMSFDPRMPEPRSRAVRATPARRRRRATGGKADGGHPTELHAGLLDRELPVEERGLSHIQLFGTTPLILARVVESTTQAAVSTLPHASVTITQLANASGVSPYASRVAAVRKARVDFDHTHPIREPEGHQCVHHHPRHKFGASGDGDRERVPKSRAHQISASRGSTVSVRSSRIPPGRGGRRNPDLADSERGVALHLAQESVDIIERISATDAVRWNRRVATDGAAVLVEDRELAFSSSNPRSKRLQASAYLATSRSVFCSPVPPIRMGGRGVWMGRATERLRELVVLPS